MLINRFVLFISLLALFVWCEAQAFGAEGDNCEPAYKPNLTGKPGSEILVGGGTRIPMDHSAKESANRIMALAPEQPGLTSKAEPTFYWWARQPSSVVLNIGNITQPQSAQFEVSNSASVSGLPPCLGINHLPLVGKGFRLKKGVQYRWTVTSVNSKNEPGRLSSTGIVLYQEPNPELKQKLRQADPQEHAQIYAREGYWYDALELLWQQIESQPDNSQKQREMMVDFLEKAGLDLSGFRERMFMQDARKK